MKKGLIAGMCAVGIGAGLFVDALAGLPNVKWHLSPHAKIDGSRLVVDVPAEAGKGMHGASAVIDLMPYEGRTFGVAVKAEAGKLSEPEKSTYGLKVMLHFSDPLSGLDCWPEAPRPATPFAWRRLELGDALSGGSRSPTGVLFLGLQGVSGRIVFDLDSLEIISGESYYPRVNGDHVAAYTDRVRNAPPMRGVMLPARDCTEDDFRTLRDWGATLGRYQMTDGPRERTGEKPADYLARYRAWLAGRLDHLDREVLPWAVKYGLKIVIDLHTPPGARAKGSREFRMFREQAYADEFLALWRGIAKRFVGRDGVYGYDLVNEPDQCEKTPYDYWTIQRLAAEEIRKIDPETPIIIESNGMDSPRTFGYLSPLTLTNVIYQLHMYEPGDYTHQGVHGQKGFQLMTYPTAERNRAYLKRMLAAARKFELKHRAKLYVGEFSAAAWAGGADRYLADLIGIFREYGWDWTYHAFREWPGWSVEHEPVEFGTAPRCFVPSADNARKRALLNGLVAGRTQAERPVAFAGRWITDAKMAALAPKPVYARQLQRDKLPKPDPKVRDAHILFRKAFELGAVREAKVRITADDYYKLYVNGVFVGQGPAAGTPDHTYCNEIDVTRQLKPGRNVLAVHTYYQGLVNRVWMSGDNRHGLLLDLVADGRTVVASDDTFLTARHGAYSALGIVGYDTQFMERYDAGAREVGFERPDFDDSGWARATVHPLGRDYTVYAQPTPMLTFERVRPVGCERLPNGGLRLDFGGIYVGALTFAAKGPKGAEVVIRCGQELAGDGSVRHRIRANCDYVERFALSGKGRDTLDPFDYKSFRYVELQPTGGAEIDAESAVLVARHMPFALKAKPTFTDPRMEPIWKLCTDSFRYGVQEQIQDCMDREKGYYLGDGCYTMITYCRLTQDWAWARRFMDDFLRTAKIDRGLITCANCSFMQEIAEYPFMFIWFAKTYLDETGDVAFVRDRFAAFRDVLDSYRERYARKDGLIANLDKWCVVEWPKNFQDGYDADVREGKVCTDLHNAVNAWYVGAVQCLDEIAERVGEARSGEAETLAAAFRKVFYDRDRHLFVDREGSRHVSLPGNVYAAFFNLAPKDDAAAHRAAFTALVREKRYSSISMFQFFPLFAWLRDNGEKALLDELILSPDAWLRNLREGGTRTFEGWGRDTKWNTSLFHLTIASLAWFLCE